MTTTQKPWLTEPNSLTFESHGYGCHIQRVHESGHLCGYVGVPSTHPLHGCSHSKHHIGTLALAEAEPCYVCGQMAPQAVDSAIRVHGGVTFSDHYAPGLDGNPDGLWWFGFDCAHSGDMLPKHDRENGRDTYKDIAYVRAECESLAEQLKKCEASQ